MRSLVAVEHLFPGGGHAVDERRAPEYRDVVQVAHVVVVGKDRVVLVREEPLDFVHLGHRLWLLRGLRRRRGRPEGLFHLGHVQGSEKLLHRHVEQLGAAGGVLGEGNLQKLRDDVRKGLDSLGLRLEALVGGEGEVELVLEVRTLDRFLRTLLPLGGLLRDVELLGLVHEGSVVVGEEFHFLLQGLQVQPLDDRGQRVGVELALLGGGLGLVGRPGLP